MVDECPTLVLLMIRDFSPLGSRPARGVLIHCLLVGARISGHGRSSQGTAIAADTIGNDVERAMSSSDEEG
eukprot:2184233-Pleurochrysis_carterae.AAC.2